MKFNIDIQYLLDIQFFEEQLSEGTAVVGDFYLWAYLDYSDLEYSGEKLFEFSNNVSVGIQFNLYTQLLINKESVSAVANYDDNFVDFSYKVIIKPTSQSAVIAKINFAVVYYVFILYYQITGLPFSS